MNANEIPANVTFAEYTGETDFRNIVDTINVNGIEYGIRVRRMHGLNPAIDGEYYVLSMPDEAKADQREAALKAAGHKATPDEYGVIVCTWEACMAGVEMLNQEQPAPEFSELSHAAQCLDIYLHNTREIYERYTVPAIKEAARRMRLYGVNIPANEAIANTPANLAKLHALAVNGSPMFYIWLDAVDDAATTSVYLTEDAARADIARLEADDKEAGIYEPDAYRIINAAPYFA